MRIRPVFIFLLVPVLCFGVFKWQRIIAKTELPKTSKLKVSPEQILEEYSKQYRLSPDRRFLRAVGLLNSFFTNKKVDDSAIATWNNGQWSVVYHGRNLGHLPEIPDYLDYMRILTDWAATLNQNHPLKLDPQAIDGAELKKKIDNFFSEDLMTALTEINNFWNSGHRSEEAFKNATRGLIYLTLQSLDSMGIGDEVPSQAWAILAAYKSVTGNILPQEETLFAENLSYSNHAKKLSSTLPEGDIVRAYINKDILVLRQNKSDKLAQYLILMYLVKNKEAQDVLNFIKSDLSEQLNSMAVVKSLVGLNDFTLNRTVPELIPSLILSNLFASTGQLGEHQIKELFGKLLVSFFNTQFDLDIAQNLRKNLQLDKAGRIQKFYAHLPLLESKLQGPFLTVSCATKFYESYFFSGLYVEGIFYLDQLSSDTNARIFGLEIASSNGGMPAAFKGWYDILTDSMLGKITLDQIVTRIDQFENISSIEFSRIVEEIKNIANYGEPKLMTIIKQLCQKLDSRPQNLVVLGNYAYTTLLDIPLAKKLVGKAVEISPLDNDKNKIWLMSLKGDKKQLKELAESESLNPEDRAFAISLLSDFLGPTNVKNQLQALNSKFPSNLNVAKRYVNKLLELENYSEARSVAQAWIDQDKIDRGLNRTVMADNIAKAYFQEGLYEEGYRYIEPYIDGEKNSTFIIAIKLLNNLSRTKEAQALLQRAKMRYPYSLDILYLELQLAWEEDRYSDAALIIKEWRYPISSRDWRWGIGSTFAKVFKTKPQYQAVSAFSELKAIGTPIEKILSIPMEVNALGNHELAFNLTSAITLPGIDGLQILTLRYSYLNQSSGELKAKQWLKEKAPREMLNPLSMFLYGDKHYDLLWEVIENPQPGYGEDFVWLMRAAGWVSDKRQNETYHAKLLEYYQNNTSSYTQKLGRYLLNLETAQTIIDLAGDALDKLTEYSYYFAIKAEADGRIEEASNWYHITVNTGLIKEGEYRWALFRLWNWMAKGSMLE